MITLRPHWLAHHSDGYAELMQFCRDLVSPYTEHDVRAFNAIFRCVYPQLCPQEVRLAKRLAELMIEGLSSRQTCRITAKPKQQNTRIYGQADHPGSGLGRPVDYRTESQAA